MNSVNGTPVVPPSPSDAGDDPHRENPAVLRAAYDHAPAR